MVVEASSGAAAKAVADDASSVAALFHRDGPALAAGEATEFEDQYVRMCPQFEVGVGRYAWLSESIFLGCGRLIGPNAIAYELYRVL